MLEISIMCGIALAGAYWLALFLMGRREDVLHGDFIKGAPSPKPGQTPAPRPPLPAPLPDLRRPARAITPVPAKRAGQIGQPIPVSRQVVHGKGAEPIGLVKAVEPVQPDDPAQRRGLLSPVASDPARSRPRPEPARPDLLQSLLETIKRDLGDAVSR
jgi:hypothetical protein